jgi:hypothetical protein
LARVNIPKEAMNILNNRPTRHESPRCVDEFVAHLVVRLYFKLLVIFNGCLYKYIIHARVYYEGRKKAFINNLKR